MQVTTLSAHLGLASELDDRYQDCNVGSLRSFLIDLSPRTYDRLGYRTNTGSIPSKFYTPEQLKHLKKLDDEHTIFFYSPCVPIVFPRMEKCFPAVLLKKVKRLPLECKVFLLKGNLQRIKRFQVKHIQDEVRLFSIKTSSWKQRRDLLEPAKKFTAHKGYHSFRQ